MHLKQAVDRFYINCLFLTLGKNVPVGSIGNVRSNYSQKTSLTKNRQIKNTDQKQLFDNLFMIALCQCLYL